MRLLYLIAAMLLLLSLGLLETVSGPGSSRADPDVEQLEDALLEGQLGIE